MMPETSTALEVKAYLMSNQMTFYFIMKKKNEKKKERIPVLGTTIKLNNGV